MALIQLRFFSRELGMQTEVEVVMPQKDTDGEIGVTGGGEKNRYKCLYLLHGLSDDQSIWLRRTSIERYATQYGICVVMPFGGRSFYCNQRNGENYYNYIAKELPARIDEFFNVSSAREDRFITGNSMGGYGALKIALKESDTFCAAAGMSSVADIRTERFQTHLAGVLGEDGLKDEDDLFFLAEKKAKEKNKPRLYTCCGVNDFLYQDNVKLRDHLQKLDLDYTYRESEGAHTWEYWDEQIQNILKWMFS